MRKALLLSVVASTMIMAGGDIAPVEPVIEVPVQVVEEVSTKSNFYAGVAYSRMGSSISDIKLEGVHTTLADVDLEMGAVMLDLGYKINDYIAVEGRYWIGTTTDRFHVKDWTLHKAVDTDTTAWGIYAKPMYPITETFDVYGLVGYGSASLNDAKGFDGDVDGITWGVGAAYEFVEGFSFFVDYVAFTEDTLSNNSLTDFAGVSDTNYDHDFDAVNFGVNYQF